MKHNFTGFIELTAALTGRAAREIERVTDDGGSTVLDADLLNDVDTLIVISFDSFRTEQAAGSAEVEAVRTFLLNPDHLVCACPHHDIGDAHNLLPEERLQRQLAEFLHHGDRTIPPQQRFGNFARSLLAGLGVPVENRFGLRPAARANGLPVPVDVETTLDRLHILQGVETFNLHPHLPQLERSGDAVYKLEVLARQTIDPSAPPHPLTHGRADFDALLQSRPDAFAGTLLVSDTTLWSLTAVGIDSLRQLWSNVIQRPRRLQPHGA